MFLATGKHDLRGAGRPLAPDGPTGLKTYLALAPEQAAALAGHVELALFPGGYAGLQPVEAGRAVLCALVGRARLRRTGGRWEALLDSLLTDSPHLARRLSSAVPLRERPLAVAAIPYGHLLPELPGMPAGLFRLGDQAAVIPSLTGDGVAIALTSGRLAAAAWLAEGDNGAEAYHDRLRGHLRRQMRTAMLAHRIACAGRVQSWLLAVCQLWPGLMRFTAAATRCYEPDAGRPSWSPACPGEASRR